MPTCLSGYANFIPTERISLNRQNKESEGLKRFQGHVGFEVYPPVVVKIASTFCDITLSCPLKKLCLPTSVTLVYRLAYSPTRHVLPKRQSNFSKSHGVISQMV
jgi:hypothetical protein